MVWPCTEEGGGRYGKKDTGDGSPGRRRRRGRLKSKFMDAVKEDILAVRVTEEDAERTSKGIFIDAVNEDILVAVGVTEDSEDSMRRKCVTLCGDA